MLGTRQQELVVSETDIDAALAHLRTLPYRPQIPMSWDRQHLLDLLREAIGSKPNIDECHDVAPGVYAIIKPFGIDLVSRNEPDGRLQVWLLVRSAGTDPTRVTTLR
jgi:hypothetical protein